MHGTTALQSRKTQGTRAVSGMYAARMGAIGIEDEVTASAHGARQVATANIRAVGETGRAKNVTVDIKSSRKAWAEKQYKQLSAQTKKDVDDIVAALKESKAAGERVFRQLAGDRKWKLWEAGALADISAILAGLR